jgi:hypothetical protein
MILLSKTAVCFLDEVLHASKITIDAIAARQEARTNFFMTVLFKMNTKDFYKSSTFIQQNQYQRTAICPYILA